MLASEEKSLNRENAKIKHIFKKHITVEEMKEYSFPGVYVDEDVINKNGVALVPKGTDLESLAKFAPGMEETLRKWGIISINISIQEQIEVKTLENIIKSSAVDFMKVDPKFARDTVEQVSDVYGRIANGVCEPEDISNLVDQGNTLAKAVVQAPEIMFCLGHVRESDEYTYVHSLNVALIGGFVANKLFPGNEDLVRCLSTGGVLHDLGKARVPSEILNKPGPLTDPEFEIMKKHTIYGEELAKGFGVHDPRILSVIRGHHERYSGNGYPDVLSADKISIEAKISAVADVFDALTAKRVYKEPMECRNAIIMMIEKMSQHFDPVILRALVTSIGLYPPGATVELSDGSLGVVVGTSGKDLVRPNIMISFDKNGRKAEGVQIIDLSKIDEKADEPVFIKKVIQDLGKIAF